MPGCSARTRLARVAATYKRHVFLLFLMVPAPFKFLLRLWSAFGLLACLRSCFKLPDLVVASNLRGYAPSAAAVPLCGYAVAMALSAVPRLRNAHECCSCSPCVTPPVLDACAHPLRDNLRIQKRSQT